MGELLAALAEDPRIADGMAADHDAGGARLGEDRGGAGGRGDVAVGEDGAADMADGPGDGVVMHLAAIHLLHGAAVNGEKINAVLVHQIEDALEIDGVVEADRSEERRVGKEGRSRWSPYH